MNLEDFLASKLRIKILKVLMDVGELNVSNIAKRVKANYQAVDKHLKILESENIVKHKVFGRIRLYRVNYSPKAEALKKLIEVWEQKRKT